MRFLPFVLVSLAGIAPAAAQDWTGFYIGAGLGLSEAHSIDHTDASQVSTSVSSATSALSQTVFRADGHSDPFPSGHVLAGYGMQHGPFLFGLEADAVFAAVQSTHADFEYDCADYDVCLQGGVEGHVRPLGHVRGMIGVVNADQTIMAFLAGGIAAAEASADVYGYWELPNSSGEVRSVGDSKTVFGPSIGIGIEMRVMDSLRLRAEGLVDGFGAVDYAGDLSIYETDQVNLVDADIFAEGTMRFTNTTARVSAIWEF